MINYIQEMMKTARVEKRVVCSFAFEQNEYCNHDCYICESSSPKYPTFTPEKKLEIIKLIAVKKGYAGMGELLDWYSEIGGLNLTQALAQLTTELMKAGELDKEKVKEILER